MLLSFVCLLFLGSKMESVVASSSSATIAVITFATAAMWSNVRELLSDVCR